MYTIAKINPIIFISAIKGYLNEIILILINIAIPYLM